LFTISAALAVFLLLLPEKERVGSHTKSIEAIQVGERVVAANPEGSADDEEVDQITWRRINLVSKGCRITLLRPLWWLEGEGIEVDSEIDLVLPEMGIDGIAKVVGIGACPNISRGAGQVVTGTFAHREGKVYDLVVEGLTEPLSVTGGHTFWSEDRQSYVPASSLRIGESLRTLTTKPRVMAIKLREGLHNVYNIEVNQEHVYHVTATGILVHNASLPPPIPTPTVGSSIQAMNQSLGRSAELAAHAAIRARFPHYRYEGFISNTSGNGIDLIYFNRRTGRYVFVEVKYNTSGFGSLQKALGPYGYFQHQVSLCAGRGLQPREPGSLGFRAARDLLNKIAPGFSYWVARVQPPVPAGSPPTVTFSRKWGK
jgi:hypothetical protein